MTQGAFLDKMGLILRVSMLSRNNASRAESIRKAARRLVDMSGMGQQYKVLGLTGGDWVKSNEQGIWPFVEPKLEPKEATTQ